MSVTSETKNPFGSSKKFLPDIEKLLSAKAEAFTELSAKNANIPKVQDEYYLGLEVQNLLTQIKFILTSSLNSTNTLPSNNSSTELPDIKGRVLQVIRDVINQNDSLVKYLVNSYRKHDFSQKLASDVTDVIVTTKSENPNDTEIGKTLKEATEIAQNVERTLREVREAYSGYKSSSNLKSLNNNEAITSTDTEVKTKNPVLHA